MLKFVKSGVSRIILLGIFAAAAIYVNVIDKTRPADSEK